MIEAAKSMHTEVYSTHYDQKQCDIGIVHIGYGAFHRVHQAVFLDDYMETSGDLRWGIAAVNLQASQSENFSAIQNLENGYLLKTTAPDGSMDMRLVRSHIRFADWTTQADETLELIALSSVHVVTIIVTESGYYLNNEGRLNVDDPVIEAEISGQKFCFVYAYLVAALKRRMQSNGQAINILCCDNIRANGHMLENNFLSYLKHKGETELANWVSAHVSFPCSMVDRITPRATPDLEDEISGLFPGQSLAPIHSEQFIQWVLEEKFLAPVPELTRAGVEIVPDVEPYEETKIRILNGGHTCLCYFGALAGHDTYDQTFADPDFRKIFNDFEQEEVLFGLADVAVPFDKSLYLDQVAARFSNVSIADQLERICMDGYSKMPIYIRPTLLACFKHGKVPETGLACVASWYIYARNWAQGHARIPYREPYWHKLEPLLAKGAEREFAQHKALWGQIPEQYPEFATKLVNKIQTMDHQWQV